MAASKLSDNSTKFCSLHKQPASFVIISLLYCCTQGSLAPLVAKIESLSTELETDVPSNKPKKRLVSSQGCDNRSYLHFDSCTGEFTERVRELSSQLCVTLYTLYIYPSAPAHKQLRRHLPKHFFVNSPVCKLEGW